MPIGVVGDEKPMFKRRWIWFGKLISDEGFTLAYGNRSITYTDTRGSFQFGFEDELLFTPPFQTAGTPLTLSQSEVEAMVERVIGGIRSEGNAVQLYCERTVPSRNRPESSKRFDLRGEISCARK